MNAMNTREGTDFKIKSQSKLTEVGLANLNPNMITPNHNLFLQYISKCNETIIVPASYAHIANRQEPICYSKVNGSYSYNSYGMIFSNSILKIK